MSKKKVLVTGAGGYIGSVSTYLLLQNGYEVVAIDNFSTGHQAALKTLQEKFSQDKCRFYQLDLRTDLSPVFDQEKDILSVIHFAASCSVDESMKHPQQYFSNNVGGTQNLLAAMLSHNIKNIVFSSTCAVYGSACYVPVDEQHPTYPLNPYGESKLITEKMIRWFGKLLGLNYVILRYFNVCGASDDGLIGDSKNPSVLLVQNAVRGALGIEPFFLTCPMVDTPDKTPIRDYINVVDLNLAHLKAVEYLLGGGKSEVLNLGTGTGNSVLEMVDQVQKMTGTKFPLQKAPPRQGEYAKMIASIKKARQVLKWQPERSLNDSINSLIKWYKAHPDGWQD